MPALWTIEEACIDPATNMLYLVKLERVRILCIACFHGAGRVAAKS